MKLIIGADHGGFALKEHLKQFLTAQGHEVFDQGTHDGAVSVDYPAYALPVARAVVAGEYELGILVCGTGIGVSIAANKVRGARAALCTDATMARLAREHNQANILCLGGRILGAALAEDIVTAFLAGQFQGGRHARRVAQLAAIEKYPL